MLCHVLLERTAKTEKNRIIIYKKSWSYLMSIHVLANLTLTCFSRRQNHSNVGYTPLRTKSIKNADF